MPKKQEEIKKTIGKPLKEKVEERGEKTFKSFSKGIDEDQKFKEEKDFKFEFKRDRDTKKDPLKASLKKAAVKLPKEVGQEIKNQVIDRDLESGYRVVKNMTKEGLDIAKALASGNPKS